MFNPARLADSMTLAIPQSLRRLPAVCSECLLYVLSLGLIAWAHRQGVAASFSGLLGALLLPVAVVQSAAGRGLHFWQQHLAMAWLMRASIWLQLALLLQHPLLGWCAALAWLAALCVWRQRPGRQLYLVERLSLGGSLLLLLFAVLERHAGSPLATVLGVALFWPGVVAGLGGVLVLASARYSKGPQYLYLQWLAMLLGLGFWALGQYWQQGILCSTASVYLSAYLLCKPLDVWSR